ncbi:MAG: hypothetical protein JXR60_02185 [Bacteroidales bacterium]|nr:hypothetical protein [Bacteroidales bacterium]
MGIVFVKTLKNIQCAFHMHKFETVRYISNDIKEIRCQVCGREYAVYSGIDQKIKLNSQIKKEHDNINNLRVLM